jgi:hypothetical protein
MYGLIPLVDSHYDLSPLQTARIWDYKTGIMKSELREHDRQVEVVEFAPVNSYPYIRTLIGSSVRVFFFVGQSSSLYV